MTAYEVNFDGLVGPTHNYAGLAFGNIASIFHKMAPSNPRAAALEGLNKMELLLKKGARQAILPPHERPYLPALASAGYTGDPETLLPKVWKEVPELFLMCCSASSMWTANAATMTPSSDSGDGNVHFTPANLLTHPHRKIEAPATFRFFKKIFKAPCFTVHPPLPSDPELSDEGAANHTRFCTNHASKGVHLFVYGRTRTSNGPKNFPARQTKQASQAVTEQHHISHVIYAQQNPDAIDAGIFHNDVISVGNESLFLVHENAFTDTSKTISELREEFKKATKKSLCVITVPDSVISFDDAVQSYFFNSQLITLPDGLMTLIAPEECRAFPKIISFLEETIASTDNPLNSFETINLRQSMQNGGGPACLRLRVVLTEKELEQVHPDILLTPEKIETLRRWVNKHYRDSLSSKDLTDPKLYQEMCTALDELTSLLHLGNLYSFQG